MWSLDNWFYRQRRRILQSAVTRRPRPLAVERLEDRLVPTGDPAYAIGAGSGHAPEVRVLDSAGQTVRSFLAYDSSFTGGVRVAIADLNRDGVPDVVTAPGAGGGPHVKVWDGKTGDVIASFMAYDPSFTGGVCIAAGPIGGGEYGVVTGADTGGGPHVQIFTAAGQLRRSFMAYDPSFRGGVEVAIGRGADGNVTINTAPGAGGGPDVRTFSARTGSLIRNFMAYDPSFRGGVAITAIDLNEDGATELITAPGQGGGPEVRVFDGATDKVQTSFFAANPADRSGLGLTAGETLPDHQPVLLSLANDAGTPQAYALTTDGATPTTAPAGAFADLGPNLALAADSFLCQTGDVWVPCGTDPADSGPSCPVAGGLTENGEDAGRAPPNYSAKPVRYSDGVIAITATDFASEGFGWVWGQDRSWSNSPGGTTQGALGNRWVTGYTPSLSSYGDGQMIQYTEDGSTGQYFDLQADGTYLARYRYAGRLDHDDTNAQFVLTDPQGNQLRFWDFSSGVATAQQGQLVSRTGADGNTITVTATTTNGSIAEVQRTATVGGQSLTESLLFTYYPVSGGVEQVETATLRRRTGTGSWQTVRSAEYSYYDGVESYGNLGDLKQVVVKDAAGSVLDTSYYRYYTAGESNGYEGGLKYAFGPQAYAQLAAAVADPQSADDATIAPYADNYFEYDDLFRVTKEVASGAGCSACSGGQGTYLYGYTLSTNADGVNSWKTETAETLPDGNTNTVYSDFAGRQMLKVYQDATTEQKWGWFTEYDADGRPVLSADPSAVTGYDDAYADLLNQQSGNYQYLADSAGRVTVTEYGSATTATSSTAGDVAGYLKQTALRRGELGTDVPQEDRQYILRTVDGDDLVFRAATTVYQNDDGTGAETTAMTYAWQGSSAQPYSITTTLPAVSTGHNGPGTAASSTVVYDTNGRPIWAKDAGGFLTYTEYDAATGAVTKTIQDVDTTQTSDFANLPTGWATPTGGGLHLTTIYEVDSLGRTTKETDPLGRVTYTVYDDPDHEVRTYAGWNATNHVPTGPTQVSREDRGGRYTETLTMSATPSVDANGRPTGTEAISSIQSLSRTYQNDAGQVIYTDNYFNLSGLTYSTSTTLGTEGTNFYRTRQGYDHAGRPNRTVSPAGTITRTVYDGQGRKVSEWIGTDDTPTTGYWSPSNLTGTDMVKVREYEYDGGGVGDGNLTQVTEHPGSGDDRVTQTWYDWRDRVVAVKQGVQATESTDVNRPLSYAEYDNLGEAVSSELYDGDGVTLTTTAGVPDRPSASLLRAKTTTAYDEQGRAYQSSMYSVNSSTGAVSTYALASDTWFDLRGNVIKTAAPGGLVQKTVYDGAGRATTVYTTDGGGDSAWSDAGNVTGDTVLEQAETQYDADGEPILTATRERFHDATGTGALGTPTSGVPARVSYTAAYYDAAGRMTASVDMGTNGGTAYTRPSSVPSRSDAALVTSQTYDAAGRVYEVTDPRGLVTRTLYDALGRTTKTIENYVDGTPSDTDDKTTEYGYGPAGMTSLTLDLAGGGVQTTAWVYGVTTAGGSAIASNDIAGETRWPDPTTGAASSTQKDVVTVNALGQTVTSTDRNGTTHTLTYDVLGRVTADSVTALGSGVDGAVRRIETAYDGQGNPYLVTSYDAATGGNIVNQVRRDFNGLGQLTADWQEHAGAVTGSSVRVQYAYTEMSGGANNSRQTNMTYPNGRVVSDNYTTGLDDAISRLSSLSDSSATLEAYSYLGLGTIVARLHPQPGVDLTYIKQAGESNGDAGDQYTGLDRFGRVVDQRWIVASTGVATDRFQYGYDRDGNRTYRDNLVNSAFGEVYSYDGLNQIASFERGTLNGTKDGVTGTASRSQSWDYDAAGNFDSVTTDGTAQTRTANAQNEITGISGATTPTFDAAGNMTGDETGKQFVYDAWNRLVAVKDSGGTTLETFSYDGLNRRVTQTAAGTTTDLYYSDQWQVLEERVGGVATTQYVWSPAYVDALVERDRDTNGDGTLDERLYAQQDANWNTTALISTSGSVVERYAYDAFGKQTVLNPAWTVIASSGVNWLIGNQGMRHDSISNLDEANRRWYSEVLMRWVTTDPKMFAAGDNNLYRFVGDDPNNRTDPSGLRVHIIGVGGTFVFAAGGGLSVFYASDDCGNYGYFIGASPQFGLAGSIDVQSGIYGGTLEQFSHGFTFNFTVALGPVSGGPDIGVRGGGSGAHGGIGYGGGASFGASFSGLITSLPHELGKKCPPPVCPKKKYNPNSGIHQWHRPKHNLFGPG